MTRTPPFFPSNPPLLRENVFLLAPSVYSLSLLLPLSPFPSSCSVVSLLYWGDDSTHRIVCLALCLAKSHQRRKLHTHTHILTHPTKTKETYTSLTSLSLSAFRLPPSKRHPSLPRCPLP